MEMESEGESSGSSRVEDGSLPRSRSRMSLQWLHTDLSDVDARVQRMLDLLEGDGETFAERAEMYYRRRPEVVEMLKDWHKSYCSLARKHENLRSHHVEVMTSSRSVSTSSSSSSGDEHAQSRLSRRPGSSQSDLDFAMPTTIQAELYPEDQYTTFGKGERDLLNCITNRSPVTTCLKVDRETKEKEEFKKTSETWEETLKGLEKTYVSLQVELIRRNDEKREKIKELSSWIDLLPNENADRAEEQFVGPRRRHTAKARAEGVSASEIERVHPQEIHRLCWFSGCSV